MLLKAAIRSKPKPTTRRGTVVTSPELVVTAAVVAALLTLPVTFSLNVTPDVVVADVVAVVAVTVDTFKEAERKRNRVA